MAMAAFDTSRPASGLSAGNLSTVFINMFSTVAAWNDARITRNSLSKLTARELDDIGLSYGDIEKIATRVARYAKTSLKCERPRLQTRGLFVFFMRSLIVAEWSRYHRQPLLLRDLAA
jgi:uncharacterized protein YjiS (DUF1127 family)